MDEALVRNPAIERTSSFFRDTKLLKEASRLSIIITLTMARLQVDSSHSIGPSAYQPPTLRSFISPENEDQLLRRIYWPVKVL